MTPDQQRASWLDYEEALDRLMGLADFERSTHSPEHVGFHLERMGLLLRRMGNPHLGIPTIHIAGTKGKGSTAAMVTSILTAQGYRVGLYTSPHLHRALERVRIGLEPIAPDVFAAVADQVWPEAEWVTHNGGYGGMTTFEVLTAMAFLHFQQVGVDFQVVEVGLGGRLDSTNVVQPEVCAITSISLDHTATLGDTVELIAFEKAGIIKGGVPVVVAPQTREALVALRRVAEERQAPIVDVAGEMSWRRLRGDLEGQSFEVTGSRGIYELSMPLLGDHQLENAGTAIAVVTTLAEKGFALSMQSVISGLRDVRWPARLQVLSSDGPLVVVDGAHNAFSMKRLVEAVQDNFEYERIVAVFGALGGHSASGMLDELAALSPSVVAVRSRHPRAAPAEFIASAASERGLSLLFESEDVAGATRRALEMTERGDLVLGTGSLSVAAEVIETVEGVAPELYPNIKRPSWRWRDHVRA